MSGGNYAKYIHEQAIAKYCVTFQILPRQIEAAVSDVVLCS